MDEMEWLESSMKYARLKIELMQERNNLIQEQNQLLQELNDNLHKGFKELTDMLTVVNI